MDVFLASFLVQNRPGAFATASDLLPKRSRCNCDNVCVCPYYWKTTHANEAEQALVSPFPETTPAFFDTIQSARLCAYKRLSGLTHTQTRTHAHTYMNARNIYKRKIRIHFGWSFSQRCNIARKYLFRDFSVHTNTDTQIHTLTSHTHTHLHWLNFSLESCRIGEVAIFYVVHFRVAPRRRSSTRWCKAIAWTTACSGKFFWKNVRYVRLMCMCVSHKIDKYIYIWMYLYIFRQPHTFEI